jgi:hypothetical protein
MQIGHSSAGEKTRPNSSPSRRVDKQVSTKNGSKVEEVLDRYRRITLMANHHPEQDLWDP